MTALEIQQLQQLIEEGKKLLCCLAFLLAHIKAAQGQASQTVEAQLSALEGVFADQVGKWGIKHKAIGDQIIAGATPTFDYVKLSDYTARLAGYDKELVDYTSLNAAGVQAMVTDAQDYTANYLA